MTTGKRRWIGRIVGIAALVLLAAYVGIGFKIAHEYKTAFARVDYDSFRSDKAFLYEETDTEKYPRTEEKVMSDGNELATFFYRQESPKGVIVVAPGHTDANDIKIYEIQYFYDAGYDVVCFDYRGYYNSTGEGLGSFSNAAHDLDAVLSCVEELPEYEDLPLYLFGHSMGAYACCAVLPGGHRIDKVVAASGFDTPKEQLLCQTRMETGALYPVIRPMALCVIELLYGEEADLSAIAGINSCDLPILILSGTTDRYYDYDVSPLYAKSSEVTNPNCRFVLLDKEGHNDHYGYFLTDEAVKYRASRPEAPVDRALYMQHDPVMMQEIIDFYEEE
ncbi:MAG: alpha/beta fold hydrolase [Lachnospiraceae bacterium]|nr:alpha/beta fold hydrolase [Lachnospiraceae bacterium]